jgi:ADP-heptose:LPS heptosyltransferase
VPRDLAPATLVLPDDARAAADARLAGRARPLIGIHAPGGRESKQWHLDRFAAVGRAVAERHGGTIVLTGGAGDRAIVDRVKRDLSLDPSRVVDACGDVTLPELAAVLDRLDVLLTGDTGPMHLATAVGTPTVALFGPSDPRRYGPRSAAADVIRIDLPCAPCGQVRLPPERCRGHVPDCLDGINVARVTDAVVRRLQAGRVKPG